MIWPVRDICPDGATLLYNRGCVICWLRRVMTDAARESLTIGISPGHKLKKAGGKNEVLLSSS
jgi:hypothetical protein